MENNTAVNATEENVSVEAVAENKNTKDEKNVEKDAEFRFFKCCSASLKRLAIVMFVVSLFISVSVVGITAVLLGVYIGGDMLTLLALPLVTALAVLVVVARLISGLIYGFAEIVEKHENR